MASLTSRQRTTTDTDKVIASVVRANAAAGRAAGFNETRREFFECPAYLLPALRVLDRFRAREEQARELVESGLFDAEYGLALRAVDQLVEQRLVVLESELGARTQAADNSEPLDSVDVTSLYIPTRNRKSLLMRCLGSHISAARGPVTFRIVDDSRDSSERLTREDIRTYFGPKSAQIWFLGPAEKAEYLETISARVGADKTLRTALARVMGTSLALPQSIGANRNWVLLDSVGEMCVSADDDTLSETAALPASNVGGAFSSDPDPTEIAVYESFQDLEARTNFVSDDVVSLHQGLLGKFASQFWGPEVRGTAFDHENISPHFVRRLLTGRCRIRLTAMGQAGDPGRGGLHFLLRTGGSRGTRPFPDEDALRRTLTTPTVLRHVLQRTISDSPHFMSTHFGLDHRVMLPPLFPVGHNDDGVFAEMLLALLPDAAIGHLPMGIRHEAPRDRAVRLQDVKRLVPSLSAFVGLAFQEFRRLPPGETSADAIRRAGALFLSLGNMSEREFEHFIVWHWRRFLIDQLATLDRALYESEAHPSFWAQHTGDVMAGIQQQLKSERFPVPVPLEGTHDESEALHTTRELFRDYGVVLSAWPEIWQAAVELKSEGVRPSAPIGR